MKNVFKLITVLAVAAVFMAAVPAMAQLLGPHMDSGSSNPCKVCHDTAAGTPALRGWAGTIAAGPNAGWGSKELSMLCYGCHDSGGGYLTTNAHSQEFNAFEDILGSHSYDVDSVPEDADGGTTLADVDGSSLPYTATGGEMECTSCHNVHVVTYSPFNQRSSYQAMCDECHAGRINTGGAGPEPTGANRTYSTHPTTVAVNGVSGNINLKIAGTNMNTRFEVPTQTAALYQLGGHLDDGSAQPDGTSGTINCQTCHAVHGPVEGTPGINDLLAVENSTNAAANVGSQLCEGCHFGGDAGGGTIAGGGVGTYDAPAGEWTDHPLDARQALSTPVAAPIRADWGSGVAPNLDRGAQPYNQLGTPTCSSCHDTHGGITTTPLLRGPGPGIYGGVADGWDFSYDDWCFSCHAPAAVIPDNHHSNLNNMNSTDDEFDSQLGCGDCHGVGTAGWTAHNGFWAFAVALSSTNSDFCEGCHTLDDPPNGTATNVKGGAGYTNAARGPGSASSLASLPASHGVIRDGGPNSSHLVNIPADSTQNTNMVANFTTITWSSGGTSEVYGADTDAPSCESCHNLLTNGDPADQGLTQGWKANLLLAPYEDDDVGVASGEDGPTATSHDFYGDSTYGAGDTGEALCRGCHNEGGAGWVLASPATNDLAHNPEAHTRAEGFTYPLTNDGLPSQPYGRTTSTVLTVTTTTCPEVSVADAGATGGAPSPTEPDESTESALSVAPGGLSYPPTANDVDCDSCHRPHNADADSYDDNTVAWTNNTGERWLILEITDTDWATTICAECHDETVQCL